MVKTYLKTLERTFKKHVTRLLSIIFMVLISVGFIAGFGSSADKINDSLSLYYRTQNVSDFIVKSDEGFDDAQIDYFKNRYGERNVNAGLSFDVNLTVNGEEQLVRLYFLDGEQTVNIPAVIDQKTFSRQDAPEVLARAEKADNKIKGFALGEIVRLDFKDILKQLAEQNGGEAPDLSLLPDSMATVAATVGETVQSPLTFASDGEPSYTNPPDTKVPDTIGEVNALITLDNILYLPYDAIPVFLQSYLGRSDLYIAAQNRGIFSAFSDDYRKYVDAETEAVFGEATVLTLYDNYSFLSLHSYAEKVRGICIVLMVAFLLVTALVVLSTMTRMLDEERAQIGCLRTLGYSTIKIVFKYVLFAAIATGIGGTGGYFVGIGLTRLIYVVFNYSFTMPPMATNVTIVFFLITFITIVVTTLAATVIAGIRLSNGKPADLLRPKAPKAGKKVILERIPFLWKLLSFKYKSTMRNVLRYMGRFLMTVVAVAFSTALMLAAFGLLDLCLFQGLYSPSVMGIAVVVVIFAGLLTAVVIYTLTNINISERNRELATLKVLGYFDGEVAGYIYREVYIDGAIGILFGYPLSLLIMKLIYGAVGMGTIAGISWFMWLPAPFAVLAFTALVTLLLRRKIVRIDMNESLKAIE